jgi:hypothetical protein
VAGRDRRVAAGPADDDGERRSTYRYGSTVVEVIPAYPAHTFGD